MLRVYVICDRSILSRGKENLISNFVSATAPPSATDTIQARYYKYDSGN